MIPYSYISSPVGTIGAMSVVVVAGAACMASMDDMKVVTSGGYRISNGTDMYGLAPNSHNLPIAKTKLGEKLLAYRKQILDEGLPLLNIDEINEIVREARRNV
jgi:hypothetical protein